MLYSSKGLLLEGFMREGVLLYWNFTSFQCTKRTFPFIAPIHLRPYSRSIIIYGEADTMMMMTGTHLWLTSLLCSVRHNLHSYEPRWFFIKYGSWKITMEQLVPSIYFIKGIFICNIDRVFMTGMFKKA